MNAAAALALALAVTLAACGAAGDSPLPSPAGGKGKNRPEVSLKASGPDVDVNVTGSVRVVAVGKSPNFKIFPTESSTAFIMIKFGKIYEATPSGNKVNSHSITSLASETAAFTHGLGNLGDLVNVTFVSMQLQLASASGFSLGCSGSGSQLASPATVTSLATSYITITTYIGIYNATSVPYGANGTLAIAANSTKTNIEVSNWPFCSTSNSLVVELEILANGQDGPAGSLSGGSSVTATTASTSTTTTTSSGSVGQNASVAAFATALSPDGSTSTTTTSSSTNTSKGKPEKRAAFSLGGATVAALDFPTFGFDSVDGAQNFTVGVDLKSESSKTKIVLTFPGNASSIYYDPTTSFAADGSATQAPTNGVCRAVAASPLLALLAAAAMFMLQ